MSKNLQTAVELFKDMGYEVVHMFYDSHGNGGSVILQRERLSSMLKPDVMVIAYDRNQNVLRIYQETENKDYLLAKEILKDIRSEEPEWELIGNAKVSPCATAKIMDYHNMYSDEYIRVTSIAGHGTYASKIKASEAGKVSWY